MCLKHHRGNSCLFGQISGLCRKCAPSLPSGGGSQGRSSSLLAFSAASNVDRFPRSLFSLDFVSPLTAPFGNPEVGRGRGGHAGHVDVFRPLQVSSIVTGRPRWLLVKAGLSFHKIRAGRTPPGLPCVSSSSVVLSEREYDRTLALLLVRRDRHTRTRLPPCERADEGLSDKALAHLRAFLLLDERRLLLVFTRSEAVVPSSVHTH